MNRFTLPGRFLSGPYRWVSVVRCVSIVRCRGRIYPARNPMGQSRIVKTAEYYEFAWVRCLNRCLLPGRFLSGPYRRKTQIYRSTTLWDLIAARIRLVFVGVFPRIRYIFRGATITLAQAPQPSHSSGSFDRTYLSGGVLVSFILFQQDRQNSAITQNPVQQICNAYFVWDLS